MKVENLQNLMVSIAVRKDWADDLLGAGFTKVFRTKAEQEALTALYTAKAAKKTPSLDVARLGRIDSAGNQQVDGGYLLFTAEGQNTTTPSALVADLTRQGFYLAVAEVFEKEGESSIRLRMTWSKNSPVKVTLTEPQKKVARKYFDLVYWRVFAYFNPESVGLDGEQSPIRGSITTLNFSGIMLSAAVLQNAANIRVVHMTDADGHLSCPLRDPGARPQMPPQRCPERTPARLATSLDAALDEATRRPDWVPGQRP